MWIQAHHCDDVERLSMSFQSLETAVWLYICKILHISVQTELITTTRSRVSYLYVTRFSLHNSFATGTQVSFWFELIR